MPSCWRDHSKLDKRRVLREFRKLANILRGERWDYCWNMGYYYDVYDMHASSCLQVFKVYKSLQNSGKCIAPWCVWSGLSQSLPSSILCIVNTMYPRNNKEQFVSNLFFSLLKLSSNNSCQNVYCYSHFFGQAYRSQVLAHINSHKPQFAITCTWIPIHVIIFKSKVE